MSLDYSAFDRRGYETVQVEEGYRLWAEVYDQTALPPLDLELLGRLERVPWAGAEAADLACGTGRIGAWMLERGVRQVDGVDLTPAMLQRSRERGIYRRLLQADMTATGLEPQAYDLVVSVLALCHLPDLGPLYAEASRLTRPGGVCVLLGYHPEFLLRGIPTHFEANGRRVAIVNWIHLLSDHVHAAHAHGWRLLEMDERVVDQEFVERRAGFAKHLGLPVSHVLVWQRG